MSFDAALLRYAHAFGRWQGAWRVADAELRRACAIASIPASWDTFRRDAGAGEIGPAHEVSADATHVLATDDRRRDDVLLWLADHGAGPIAEAAGLLARMVGAIKRFAVDDLTLLDAARDALASPVLPRGAIARRLDGGVADDDSILSSLRVIAGAVDRLRGDVVFLEATGTSVWHVLPVGPISHYVAAAPGAAWALNLALLARGSPFVGVPPPPACVSRGVFRGDLDPEEIATILAEGAAGALEAAYARLEQLSAELARGRGALAHLSRNSRAREAWLLLVALRSVSRAQLGRALSLSRAGADIQARTLADAGLATLGPAGRIEWIWERPADALRGLSDFEADLPPISFAEFDASMAQIDRLLQRTAPSR